MFQEPGAPASARPKKKIEKSEEAERRFDPVLLEKLEGLSPQQLAELARLANIKLIEKVGEGPARQMLKNNRAVDSRFKTEDEARREAFESLEKQGIVSYSPEGLMLVDLGKIKSITKLPTTEKGRFKESLGQVYDHVNFGGRIFFKTLTILFEDQKVISKDDYARGEREPRDLLYLPKNKEDALDVKKIKESHFYLLLSDLARVRKWDETDFGKISSLKKDPKNGLDYREALLAVLIYHPKYSAGYRDEKDGKLYIKRNDKNGEYGKISAEYLSKEYGMMGGYSGSEGGSLQNGRLFVIKNLPNLISKRMLLPNDFEIHSETATAEKEISCRDFRQRGIVMFGKGVDHTIGNKFFTKDKRFNAYQLAPGVGGVIEEKDGQKRIVATFTIFQKEDAEKTAGGYPVAGIKKTKPIDLDRFSEKQKNESEEEFQARIKKGNSVEFMMGENNFEEYLRVREKISKEADFNLNKLPIEKQKSIMELMQEFEGSENETRFLEFIKEYKEDGLKTLFALGSEVSRRDEILKLGEKLDHKLADRIFSKFNEFIDFAENIEEEADSFGKDQDNPWSAKLDKIKADFFRRAGGFLAEFFQLSKMKKDELWKKRETEIVQRLTNFSKHAVMWTGFFNVAYREKIFENKSDNFGIPVPAGGLGIAKQAMMGNALEGKNNSFLDILAGMSIEGGDNAQLEELSGRAVKRNQKLLDQIVTKYKMNYIERPALSNILVESYLKKIYDDETNEAMKVEILRVAGELIVHCRFDAEKDNQLYFGALFAMPEGKGNSVGGCFLEYFLSEMGKKHRLQADCIPGEDISGHYVSKQGFVVDKIVQDYKDFGEPFIFHIARPKIGDMVETYWKRNNFAKKRNDGMDIPMISKEQIMKDYAAGNFSENDGRIILRYPIQKKVSLEMYPEEMKSRLTELINEKGYVMTGYFSVPGENFEKEKIVYCALELLDKSEAVPASDNGASGESSEKALE